MKNLVSLSGLLMVLVSCSSLSNNSNYPVRRTYPGANPHAPSAINTEKEYNDLLKTYKPETAEVLTDLLNSSSNSPRTSISVQNKSRCNMVLTVSGNNFYKKIPIGAGKIGYTMVQKNQSYKLSGMVCRSTYQSTKFITDSYAITLSDK